MILKEYIESLQEIAKKHPETLDYQVVTSADDEGNTFNVVYFEPSIGRYDSDDKEFSMHMDMPGDMNMDMPGDMAVCVN